MGGWVLVEVKWSDDGVVSGEWWVWCVPAVVPVHCPVVCVSASSDSASCQGQRHVASVSLSF